MSSQIMNNNTYTMAPTSPNLYISRKLNNMDQAQIMKRERRLVETVPQNAERVENTDRCTEMDKGHQEIGRRS